MINRLNYFEDVNLRQCTNNKIHAAIQVTPPHGVIIPKALTPEIAKTYREPENKMIPVMKR